jgi:uncharacterized lipoprotein YajG
MTKDNYRERQRTPWCAVAACALLALAGCQSGGVGDGGDTIVTVPPYAAAPSGSPPAAGSSGPVALSVRERPLGTGELPGRIGERATVGNISMGFVTIDPPPAGLVSDALAAELRAAGHDVTAAAPSKLQADVRRFHLRTDVTPVYWDVIGEAEVGVTLSGTGPVVSSAYRANCSERTYLWPTNALMARVVTACVAGIAQDFRNDAEMARVLARH